MAHELCGWCANLPQVADESVKWAWTRRARAAHAHAFCRLMHTCHTHVYFVHRKCKRAWDADPSSSFFVGACCQAPHVLTLPVDVGQPGLELGTVYDELCVRPTGQGTVEKLGKEQGHEQFPDMDAELVKCIIEDEEGDIPNARSKLRVGQTHN
eukprot:1137433-Pelagomonas_calceolata.AAC.3